MDAGLHSERQTWDGPMLHYALAFMVGAIVAAVLGFGGFVNPEVIGFFKALLAFFLVMAAASFTAVLLRLRRDTG